VPTVLRLVAAFFLLLVASAAQAQNKVPSDRALEALVKSSLRAPPRSTGQPFPRDLWPKMGALGLHGITVEEEYRRRQGLGYLEHCVAMEEISPRLGLGRAVLRRAFQPLRQPDPPQRHDEQKRATCRS
jgi:alkylation response protein AidB-like acyl-CoA dehydrogenase